MAQCLTPYHLVKQDIDVPCGKCPECSARRISAWSFRLIQEDRHSYSSSFITLTYDTKHVPITEKRFMSVSKRDLQLFFKKLRKSHDPGTRIKYYCVAEYGPKSFRPHYHLLLFNCDNARIQSAWANGMVYYGQVSGASVGYTLKYINKTSTIPAHRNDDRSPVFRLMSKGLGAGYLTESMKKWHMADVNERMYCNTLDGKKIAMPRYYKNKLYDEHTRIMVGKHQFERMREEVNLDIQLLGIENYERKQNNHKIARFTLAKFRSKYGEKI